MLMCSIYVFYRSITLDGLIVTPFSFRVFKLFNHLHRILHIVKRDIRHNAVAQVENEAVLAFHAVEQVGKFFL
jgi:hypothetical protein